MVDEIPQVQMALDLFWKTAKRWGLGPNEKTVIKILGFRRNNPGRTDFNVSGDIVKWYEDEFKYLGFLFDHNLLFRKQVETVAHKMTLVVGEMKMIEARFPDMNIKQEMALWKMLCRSVLWGEEIWGWNCAYGMKIADADKTRLRAMFGAEKGVCDSGIRWMIGELNLQHQI